jgi:hypothetical protein
VTWQASWPPTRSRHDNRHPPDSNSSGVLGPARRGRGTVGDDLASGRTTLRLTPTSDQSIGRRQGPGPGAATGLQPRRHPGRRPEAPGRPRPRPQDRHRARHLHRAIGGLTVRCFRTTALRTAGVRQTRPGWRRWPCRCPRRSAVRTGVRPPTGHRPPAWTPGGPCGSHRGHATSCGPSRTRFGTAATAGHSRAASGMRAGHGRSQARGRPPCSTMPWPAVRRAVHRRLRPCPGTANRTAVAVSGVQGAGRPCGHADPAVSAAGSCRSLRVSAATGSGRLTGVRWSGAATAARPAGAAGQAARGAAHAHRSWPAAPAPGPPRRSARQAAGP